MLALLAVSGCASTGVFVLTPGQKPVRLDADNPSLPRGDLQFRVSPLDTLQVDVYPEHLPVRNYKIDAGNEIKVVLAFKGGAYRIAPGDTLELDFSSDAISSGKVLVRPDGAITLPRLGTELRATGLTPDELRAAITRAYGPLLQSSRITVSVIESSLNQLQALSTNYNVGRTGNIAIPLLGGFDVAGLTPASVAKLVGAAATTYFHNPIEADVSLAESTNGPPNPQLSPSGLQYFHQPVDVAPNGTIFVPDAGTIPAAGKTLAELDELLTKKIQAAYENTIDARVSLSKSNDLDVFVGGDVVHPGSYPYSDSLTILRLVARAGWIDGDGDLDNVFLLHRVGDNKFLLFKTNVADVIAGDAGSYQDLRLTAGDLVIVPKTGIARVDAFVEKYLRNILPFNTSVNYTLVNQFVP
ncbi:MAG: polysaccharide biosynthesis/export family protein [Rhizomicrobium sp.]